MPYILKLNPYYRHGADTPWGGKMLGELFSRNIPDETTGESIEVSAIDSMPTEIANGELKGQKLSRAFEEWGSELTGEGFEAFPLIAKIIDAKRTLSVQVHPGNDYAQKNENKLGKSESWLVLWAKPGAEIICGLKRGDGDIARRLNRMKVDAGDVIYIPSGMVHALGDGIVVYELQQSSDVTYRLWDWGSSRPLHVKKAMDVIDFDITPTKAVGSVTEYPNAKVTTYIDNEFFELSRAKLNGELSLAPGRMRIITALGDCKIECESGEVVLSAGETAVIPAGLANARLNGCAEVIIGSTPKKAL